MLTVQGFIHVSAYYPDSVIILSDYYLSFFPYPVPSHSCDQLEDLLPSSSQHGFSSVLLEDEDLEFWRWYLRIQFTIGEFLCFSCQLSPIDWQYVESFPCSTSTHLFTWPVLYWFFWIFDENLRFISMTYVAQDYVVFTYTVSRSLKTHHYCILWLQSTFVIYVVLYPYHMMYSNIVKELVFQYIEHSILIYDFVYDIIMYLFQVLPLLHWISEFSKDNDYNVFQPSLPSDLTH